MGSLDSGRLECANLEISGGRPWAPRLRRDEMTTETLKADYLVIGGGAMGMAFADELIASDKTARIIMVDQHARAGGHWNDAYSFVKLHQPAAFYGVNSQKLGPGGAALVSGTEVLNYYEHVLDKLQATGRLQFFPMCLSDGDASFRSRVDASIEYRVDVKKSIVDASYMKVEVPSIRPPAYEVAAGVALVPPNELPGIAEPASGYVIVGAGKTGIDAVLFLLEHDVDPGRIQWIMPNDAWLLDRAQLVPGRISEGVVAQPRIFAQAETLDEVFRLFEAEGGLLRLDPEVKPQKYRCATVSLGEFEQLKRVKNVVRMGRVRRIEPDAIVLEGGVLPTDVGKLHVDCSADGLAKRGVRPVFDGKRITLQSLFMCQQVFSAALIGRVEALYQDETAKNDLCQAVPHPSTPKDFLMASMQSDRNLESWFRAFPLWLLRSRLSLLSQDNFWQFARGAFRVRKFVAPARENLLKILRKEFPDGDFSSI